MSIFDIDWNLDGEIDGMDLATDMFILEELEEMEEEEKHKRDYERYGDDEECHDEEWLRD